MNTRTVRSSVRTGLLAALAGASIVVAQQGAPVASYNGFEMGVLDTTPRSWRADSRNPSAQWVRGVSRVAYGAGKVASSTGNWHGVLSPVELGRPRMLPGLWHKAVALVKGQDWSTFLDVYIGADDPSNSSWSFVYSSAIAPLNEAVDAAALAQLPGESLRHFTFSIVADSEVPGGFLLSTSVPCVSEAPTVEEEARPVELVSGWYTIRHRFEHRKERAFSIIELLDADNRQIERWDEEFELAGLAPRLRPMPVVCHTSSETLPVDNLALVSGPLPEFSQSALEEKQGALEALSNLLPTGEEDVDAPLRRAVDVLETVTSYLYQGSGKVQAERSVWFAGDTERLLYTEGQALRQIRERSVVVRAPAAVRAALAAASLRLVRSNPLLVETVEAEVNRLRTLACEAGAEPRSCEKSMREGLMARGLIESAESALIAGDAARVLESSRRALDVLRKSWERAEVVDSERAMVELAELMVMAEVAGCFDGAEAPSPCGRGMGDLAMARKWLAAAERGEVGRRSGTTLEAVRNGQHAMYKARLKLLQAIEIREGKDPSG